MTKYFRAVVTFFFLFMRVGLIAQSTNAAITGQVNDPSKAVLTQAKVTAINNDTGVQYAAQTNQSGAYVIPSLPPGEYRIQVEKIGFRTIVKPEVVLHVQDRVELNFEMAVGSATEVVTVSAGASMVNTQDGSVSTVVDQTYVKNMPLNGRSFQDLILLTPGVVTNSPQSPSSVGQDGEFSVNGQRTDANGYTVDGVSANVGATADPNVSFYATTDRSGASGSVAGSTVLGTTQALVPVDDLQEFRVQSSSYSAEYGRNPGGQFSFETKSGTNQWHGTAFDYLRNEFFDATDYFTNYFRALDPTLRKSDIRQNDFGGTLGGPIRIPHLYNGKDKTFFFVSYEGMRLILPQPAVASLVPDFCMRGLVTPGSPAACEDANGTPYLGPSGQTRAPGASALQPVTDSYPVPTRGGTIDTVNGVAQFIGAWSNPASIDTFSARIDHNVNDKLRLFFRFSDTSSDSTTRGFVLFGAFVPPTQVGVNSSTLRTYTGGANSIISSSISNEFRLNYTSNIVDGNQTIQPFGGSSPVDLVQLAGLTGFARPDVGPLYVLGSNFVQQSVTLTAGAQQQWNVNDNVGLALGRHRFSFGMDYRRLTPFALPPNVQVGYDYGSENDVETNNGLLFIQQFSPAHPLYKNLSLFAEDEWKASDRLTVSMGLRWELNPPPGVTQGLMPYTIAFQPDPNNWTLAPQGTRLWKTTWFNFAPRLGVAYALRSNQGRETVLRAGGGLFFDTGQQAGSQGFVGPGFNSDTAFISAGFPSTPATQLPGFQNPPVGPFVQVNGFYPHLQLPYTIQWNASLQQALGKSQAITASYVASHAARLLQTNGFNIPALSFNPVQVTVNGRGSDYDSLQLQFQRRLSRGLTGLASYTWSHCVDYGSSNFLNGYERENCDFDVRHNFSSAISYDLPDWGKGVLANALLHHWGFDDRFGVRSAFPVDLKGTQIFNPLTGQRLSNGLNSTGKPFYIYGANCAAIYATDFGSTLPCPGGRAINPDAFSTANGRGDVPRNVARGFGAWQMDLAVRREFPIYEHLKLQFRAEAFNIFNHPNLGTIDGQFGDSTFGQATATLASSLGVLNQLYQMGGPRSMQFALKLIF